MKLPFCGYVFADSYDLTTDDATQRICPFLTALIATLPTAASGTRSAHRSAMDRGCPAVKESLDGDVEVNRHLYLTSARDKRLNIRLHSAECDQK